MTKQEFMARLKAELQRQNVNSVDEILNDYEEHFAHGKADQKSDDEITLKLGQPEAIAKAYHADHYIAEAKKTESDFKVGEALQIIFKILVIAPFNILVLFIPFVILFSLLVAGWSSAFGIAVASVGVFFASIVIGLIGMSFWIFMACSSVSFGLFGLGALLGFVMFVVTKYVLLGILNYLQWNLKFVLAK